MVTAGFPRALYIHVPFCLHHCGYCDFTVIAGRDRLIPQYLDALQLEMDRAMNAILPAGSAGSPLEVDTIFIGGGTPTHLPPDDLQRLFQILERRFRLASGGEYSVEANPDGLCDERLTVLRDNGVNRISLGVQSFDINVLKTLERSHSPDEARKSVERAARIIDTVSLDLIFGVPGQTLESWQQTLHAAAELPVRHISTYGLTFETGTPFFRRQQSGQLRRAPEELERDMYLAGIDILRVAGMAHYEISNFACNEYHCRHNHVYWNADEYFAFGPGASRYLGGERSSNLRSVPQWLAAVTSGIAPVAESEHLSGEERAREAMMLGLRRISGISLPVFQNRFGTGVFDLAGSAIRQHLSGGLLELDGDSLRLTRAGLLLADTVAADLL